jgi:hypothetical protein
VPRDSISAFAVKNIQGVLSSLLRKLFKSSKPFKKGISTSNKYILNSVPYVASNASLASCT